MLTLTLKIEQLSNLQSLPSSTLMMGTAIFEAEQVSGTLVCS